MQASYVRLLTPSITQRTVGTGLDLRHRVPVLEHAFCVTQRMLADTCRHTVQELAALATSAQPSLVAGTHTPSAEASERVRGSSTRVAAIGSAGPDDMPCSTEALPSDHGPLAPLLLPPPPHWTATRQRRTLRVRRAIPPVYPWLAVHGPAEMAPAQLATISELQRSARPQHETAVASSEQQSVWKTAAAATAFGGPAIDIADVAAQAADHSLAAGSAGAKIVNHRSGASTGGRMPFLELLHEQPPAAASSAKVLPSQSLACVAWDALDAPPAVSRAAAAALDATALSTALQQPGYRFDTDLVRSDDQPLGSMVHRMAPPVSASNGPLLQCAALDADSGAEWDCTGTHDKHSSRMQESALADAHERAAGAAIPDVAAGTALCSPKKPAVRGLCLPLATLQSEVAKTDGSEPLFAASESCHAAEGPQPPNPLPVSADCRLARNAAAQPAVPLCVSSSVSSVQQHDKQCKAACLPPAVATLALTGPADDLPLGSTAAATSGAQSGSSAQTAVLKTGDNCALLPAPSASPAPWSQLEPSAEVCPYSPYSLMCSCHALVW